MNQLFRALKLRCPNCGAGKLFDSWIRMRGVCEHCRLKLDRGEHDYFIGAYTLNLIVAELMVVGAILLVMVATWPTVPWTAMMWSLLPLALLGPVVTLPFARSLWLALDLVFRPPEPSDFATT